AWGILVTFFADYEIELMFEVFERGKTRGVGTKNRSWKYRPSGIHVTMERMAYSAAEILDRKCPEGRIVIIDPKKATQIGLVRSKALTDKVKEILWPGGVPLPSYAKMAKAAGEGQGPARPLRG